MDKHGARSGRSVEECKDLVPAVELGTAISENVADDPVLRQVCPDFMVAHYIEFAHLRWIDTAHSEYFEQLQSIQDRYPTISFTLVVHEDGVERTRAAIELLRERARLRTVRIIVDSSGTLSDRFNVPWHCFAAFLVDSATTLRFWRCCAITISEVEQLAEKFGKTTPHTANQKYADGLLIVGEKLPELSLQSLSEEKTASLPELAGCSDMMFLFGARCSSCEMKNFLRQVSRLLEHIRGQPDQKSFCLVSDDLSEDEWRAALNQVAPELVCYIPVRSSQDRVAARLVDEESPRSVVVGWDSEGIVTSVMGIDDYISSVAYDPAAKRGH